MEKTVVLHCIVYKDGDMYTSLCLDLDVASYGETEQEAEKYLKEAIDTYIEYAIEHNKVEEMVFAKVGKHRATPKRKHATSFHPKVQVPLAAAGYC